MGKIHLKTELTHYIIVHRQVLISDFEVVSPHRDISPIQR